MTWVSEYKYSWYEKFAMNTLQAGHIPRHIAFIMDGNRRYAKSEHLQKIEGHMRGFEKLADCLRWCLDMGIGEVTAFAFSIENFKRSEDEVKGLLDLAREKFSKLLNDVKNLREHGVRIRVIGNMSLLPADLQELIARAQLKTEMNDKLFLNIAFAYTSHDEITQAVETVLLHGDALREEDISERLLEECLYLRHSTPPDLLFRSSGETRISDFLMWQITSTVIYFTKILWPQVTIWNFLGSIFFYQRASVYMEPFKRSARLEHAHTAKTTNFYTERVQKFLQYLDSYRKNFLLKLTSSSN